MSGLPKTAVVPQGLVVGDPSVLEAKMADFTASGADNMHVVLDFDRTLTVKRPGSQDEVTTWQILREHLPEDGQLQYQMLFDKYRTLELPGHMTQKDAVEWFSSVLNLFVKHKVDFAAVEADFLDRVQPRPGTLELFRLCADNGISTIILSGGIREIIDVWCQKYGIEPSLIISTSLVLDSVNKVIDWKKDTLIHTLNKSEVSHPELAIIRTNRPKVFLIGDSLDDDTMAAGNQDVIRTRILDRREDEVSNALDEQKTFDRFDAIIKLGSLHPLCDLIDTVI